MSDRTYEIYYILTAAIYILLIFLISMIPGPSAIIYQENGKTIASTEWGRTISSIPVSSHADNIVIQKAIDSRRVVKIQDGPYYLNNSIFLLHDESLEGGTFKMCADVPALNLSRITTGRISLKDIAVYGYDFNDSLCGV